MKKLILAASLMVGAAFASFAEVQMNQDWQGGGYVLVTYTFTTNGSYGILLGNRPGDYFTMADMTDFGYYFIDDPDTLISGTIIEHNSEYLSTFTYAEDRFENLTTGYLGDFQAGDTIGIYIKSAGYLRTSTTGEGGCCFTPFPHFWIGGSSGFIDFHVFELTSSPNGEPLPGVLAVLAIGGCAFLGRKFRNRIKK